MRNVETYLYIVIIGLAAWLAYRQFAPVKGLRNLSVEQFRQESRGQRIVDVREAHEFRQGHLPGAVNIPLSQFRLRMAEIPRDRPVYLYCRSGMRSRQAGRLLVRNGWQDAAHLSGGIIAWNGPLVK